MMRNFFCTRVFLVFLFFASAPIFAQNGAMSATSRVDWTLRQFVSDVTLDTERAGFAMPSGRTAASEWIRIRMPVLVKDPLFSLYIDNSNSVGDLINNGTLSPMQITGVIDQSRMTPAVFTGGGMTMTATNRIDLNVMGGLMMRQRNPYAPREPIESISSRAYTGIVIDARGSLPVHGEYVESAVQPCFFPKVWDERMNVIYERDMVDYSVATASGVVHYASSDDLTLYEERVGFDPLYVRATEVYGRNRTDPIIGADDALRILTVSENRALLAQGKVVVLLDESVLAHEVSVPEKDEQYYAAFNTLRQNVTGTNPLPAVEVDDGPGGMTILIEDLKFLPDSAELLPEDGERVALIAQEINNVVQNGGYTILIEGHTADVGRPVGEMNLSIERAQTIMNALVAAGVQEALITTRGYGGTVPAASNETEEGRRQNRRVIITVSPTNATSIQRD